MQLPLCLSSAPAQLQRWQQAFPNGRIYATINRLEHQVASGGLVWVHLSALPRPWPELTPALQRCAQGLRFIGMSNAPEIEQGLEFFRFGGRGYCHALAAPDLLRRIAGVVEEGGVWTGTAILQRLTGLVPELDPQIEKNARGRLEALSPRERQVAHLVAGGASNKEIAVDLSITERTVKAHLGSIFAKLNLRDRLQLAILAGNKG